MAILQLSRITNRKGLSDNLPQLAGAEFGWALDDRRLYIGNGTIANGAPVVGNTEILTEFSDLLALSAGYTYKGAAGGYVVNTGENDNEVIRSLQSKFDDMASVKDFGAVGDGVADDTDAINRALFELFCREVNQPMRRSLFFPAGVYRVLGKIKLPPHAKLYGEGLTSSIINFGAETAVAATTTVVGERYAIATLGDTDFTLIGASGVAPGTLNQVFVATGAGAGTGTVRPVGTDAVVETSDSLQQTGLNIGNNGATAPTGIEILSMAVYAEEEITLLKLDSVSNSGFHYVGLHGPNLNPNIGANSNSAVEIATSISPTRDITISKLDTQGTKYGLKVAGNTKGVVLENSGLDLHYQGVLVTNQVIDAANIVFGVRYKIMSLGNPVTDFTPLGATYNRVGETFTSLGSAPSGNGTVISMDDPGPTGVVVSRNIFDNIAYEGIDFDNVLFNSSGYNVFYDVGNNLGGNATPASPVITITSDQCLSVGDLFEREDEDVFPRVDLASNGGIFLDGTHSIHLGSFERQVGIEATLTEGVTDEEIFQFNHTLTNSYKIDYNVKRGLTTTRIGTIHISNAADTLTSITFNEEYTQSADTGIVFEVVNIDDGEATFPISALQFTSTSGIDATLNFSVVRLD